MTFTPVPDCAEAVVHAQVDGVNVFNVLNFWKPGGYVQTDIDNLAADVDSSWASGFLPHLHTSYHYQETTVRGLSAVIDLSSVVAVNAGAGVATGDSFPNNVAFCLTLYTGHTGRSARGRTYVGGIPASATATQNTLSSAYAATLLAALGGVKTLALADGWHLTVVSRISGGVRRTTGINTPVTSIVARNYILDSQRNRLPAGH